MTASLALERRPTSRRLLDRILDEPNLPAQVHALAPAALARLIDRIGLEDAGEIVALATTDQLVGLFDDDLWRSERAGEDERFDNARFLVWLNVMREAGDRFVANKLADLPEELVTLAFQRQVLVLGNDLLASELSGGGEDADSVEKVLSNCLVEEMDDFLVISRGNQGWDDVLAALLSLDELDHDLATRILERCSNMSSVDVEENGLYDVLSAAETLEADVAADRETRRAEMGHVAPSAAAAFLKLARSDAPIPKTEHDPLTRAYFRDVSGLPAVRRDPTEAPRAALLERLLEDGEDGQRAPPTRVVGRLSSGGQGAESDAETLLARAMRRLAEDDPEAFSERSGEIAYLANVLAAGCSVEGRHLRPVEAVAAAVATTSLGLEMTLRKSGRDSVAAATRTLREHVAEGLFRRAWHRLEMDVRLPAMTIRAATARGDLEGHETVDGLADACPNLRGSLAERAGAAAGPRWIATLGDLARVRAFLERAPRT